MIAVMLNDRPCRRAHQGSPHAVVRSRHGSDRRSRKRAVPVLVVPHVTAGGEGARSGKEEPDAQDGRLETGSEF